MTKSNEGTMTEFHEGQEVEVRAKIVRNDRAPGYAGWIVEFPNGALGLIDAEHIKALNSKALS